jgi:uncharacterized membrane protein YoaK (UPF0700 family)
MIPYVVMAGTLLVALAAPLFMGWDMWFVPLVVLPFLILYFLVDRQLAAQEKRTGGGGH